MFVNLDLPQNAWLDVFIQQDVKKIVSANFTRDLQSPALELLYCSPPTPSGLRGVWMDCGDRSAPLSTHASDMSVGSVYVWACPMAWGVHLGAGVPSHV